MSIRIQLWKGETQVGPDAVVEHIDLDTGISQPADRLVDAMITNIHDGRHGEGKFRIECDHTDDRGVFLGSYYRADLTFPRTVAERPFAFSQVKPL